MQSKYIFLILAILLLLLGNLFGQEETVGFEVNQQYRHLDSYKTNASVWSMTYRYNLLEVEPRTINAARQLANRNPLRAYDAVQLATAWLLNQDLIDSRQPPLTFVCADDRLIDIAQNEGLLAANPNRYP